MRTSLSLKGLFPTERMDARGDMVMALWTIHQSGKPTYSAPKKKGAPKDAFKALL